VRQIVLPVVLALVAFGVLTSSSLAQSRPLADPTAVNAISGENTKEQGLLALQVTAKQVVTVVGASPEATTATLTAWQRDRDGWQVAYGPIQAYVGKEGIGQASETTSHTPAGTFGLTQSFGIQANNGTRLPFFQVDDNDWWVSDSKSPKYNTHQRCAVGKCPFDEAAGERLKAAGTAYNHAVVIDYNRFPAVPGAGSAFFLHVSMDRPTAGCVSIPAGQLDRVMRWLDPAQHPVISIGT
jgi:L,D-peptidoglycan transpeptidase YkuD (ErfK/YbiS/YcfS/YnhG family)